jgi:hypothetical protein
MTCPVNRPRSLSQALGLPIEGVAKVSDKIKHFPRGEERRDRLNLRKYRVPCQVSMRWLQFPETAHALRAGDFMQIDVMTVGSDDKERKICELILTKQDLVRMLEQVNTVA